MSQQEFSTHLKVKIASPWDRLAAFVVDLVFLFPFIQILQAPLKREMSTAALLGAPEIVGRLQGLSLATFVFVFILYHTLCHYFFQKTLGKKIFGLSVEHSCKALTLYSCFIRAAVLLAELSLLGLPLLATFSHFRRRPLHDRVSDTFVVSTKNCAGSPGSSERLNAQLISGVGILTFVMLGLIVRPEVPDEALNAEQSVVDPECEIFMESTGSDLSQAIEAFSVQNIKADCLKHISSEALWKSEDLLLANLGSAFATAEDAVDLSQKYKAEVCRLEPESTACAFVQWTELKPLENGPHKVEMVQILKQRDAEDFYRIFFVTALHAHKNYEMANEVLKTIKHPEYIPEHIAETTFENLMWREKWEAGYWVFKLHRLNGEVFSRFVEAALEKKQFKHHQLKTLIEKFYPHMDTSGRSRGLASEDDAPAPMKMLWIRLAGEK